MLRYRFSPSISVVLLIICLMEVSVPPIVCLHSPLTKKKLQSKRDIFFNQHQVPPQDSLTMASQLNEKSKSSLHKGKCLLKLSPHIRAKKSHVVRHNLNRPSTISKSRMGARKRGSTCPPVEPGLLRLYSMRFCPFCERTRLVLQAKGVPHEIVNIDLKNKPDWLFKIHPEGKVPALDTGDEVIIESLDISNFLDKEYPDPPLYPADAAQKAKDQELMEKYGKVVGAAYEATINKGNKPLEEYAANILTPLQQFEDELAKRGTTFFGGSAPGMLDYMMWPWVERFDVPAAIRNEEFKFPWGKVPKLAAWAESMQSDAAVKATSINTDTHTKFMRGYFSENPVYDNL